MPGGYLYRKGLSPNTRVLNSQKVRLFGWDAEGDGTLTQIGLIQTWNPSHTRTVEPVRGVGFGDQIAEQAVGVTELTASVTVMMMYLRDVMQIFGYKAGSSGLIRSLKHHRWPFDVQEEVVIPTFLDTEAKEGASEVSGGTIEDETKAVITYYEGCWMTDYSKTFDVGAASVTQDCSMNITDVFEPITGNNASAIYADISGNLEKKSTLYAFVSGGSA